MPKPAAVLEGCTYAYAVAATDSVYEDERVSTNLSGLSEYGRLAWIQAMTGRLHECQFAPHGMEC
jgi:hypothetical protein